MRIVELSNHPDAMRRAARDRRAAEAARLRAGHERELAEHERAVGELAAARDAARAERRWWRWWRLGSAVRAARRSRPAPPREPAADPDRERILLAGIAGEALVAEQLGEALGDEWTLLRGYRNGGGEIDHLLLGPRGVAAIEVKHRNATVYCDGDDWWFEKYDRYGNLVESGEMADRRGRSPSRQLNEPVEELVRHLRRRRCDVPITRLLLFTHERSVVDEGNLVGQTVDGVGTSGYEVAQWLATQAPTLSAARLAKVEQLIVRDHAFHEARRRRPRQHR